jgi:hypothetical protein
MLQSSEAFVYAADYAPGGEAFGPLASFSDGFSIPYLAEVAEGVRET